MASRSRPPPSPRCPATPHCSTTWASAWTVWWRRADTAGWDRPSEPWRGARPLTSPQAAVQDTPTSPPARPRGWTRWTTPSFDFDHFEACSLFCFSSWEDPTPRTHEAFYVSFYYSPRLVHWFFSLVILGEEEKEGRQEV